MPKQLLGFFSPKTNNVVLQNYNTDIINEEATAIHEAIHAQLSKATHYGALKNLLYSYHEYLDIGETKLLFGNLVQYMDQHDHFVHEAIATYATVMKLAYHDPIFFDYKKYLGQEYQNYLESLDCFIDNVNQHEDTLTGIINLGLSVFNSKIFDSFLNLTSIELDEYKKIIDADEHNPLHRLTSIVRFLRDENIKIWEFNAGRKFDDIIKKLFGRGIYCSFKTREELEKEAPTQIESFLNHPLMQLNKGVTKRFSNAIVIDEQNTQFENFVEQSAILIERNLDFLIVNIDQLESVLFDTISNYSNQMNLIIEVREDIFESSNRFIITFCPFVFNPEYTISSFVDQQKLREILQYVEQHDITILISSRIFNFASGQMSSTLLCSNPWIVIPFTNKTIIREMLSNSIKRFVPYFIFFSIDGKNENTKNNFLFIEHKGFRKTHYSIMALNDIIMDDIYELLSEMHIREFDPTKMDQGFENILNNLLNYINFYGFDFADYFLQNGPENIIKG